MTLTEAKTVGDFIDLLQRTWASRPKNGDEMTRERRKLLDDEIAVEQIVHRALSFHGALVHNNQVWYAHTPPRLGVVGHMNVKIASQLPWTMTQE